MQEDRKARGSAPSGVQGQSPWPSFLLLLTLTSCHHRPAAVAPPPPLRYVLEPAYQAAGIWYYPHETFNLDVTGLAAVIPPGHAPLTTDNEPYDANAMAAAMQTVQLPAIATVTNLENGRQLLLRVNDRGPDSPTRLIAVTPRVAALLGFASPATRIRVRLDADLSTALSHQTQGHAADIAIDAAPRSGVQQTDLAPLAGTAQEQARAIRTTTTLAQTADAAPVTVPLRIAPAVTLGYAEPGVLMIDAGVFTHESAARDRVAALADVDARLIRARAGGQTSYIVRAGPYDTPDAADAALDRIIASGIIDARIVVDLE